MSAPGRTTAWRWAALGGVLGLLLTLVMAAPARWLTAAVAQASGGRVQFVEKPNVDPMALIRLIQGQPTHYKMDGPDKLRIIRDLPDATNRFNAARGLLAALAPG